MSRGPAHSFDDLVVGAGTAGLTAALLLARFGRSVLLVDGAPAPGGGLRRFRRGGAAFDTGFHFSGSVRPGELLDRLLRQLDIRDAVTLLPYDTSRTHRFLFRNARTAVEVPAGLDQACACWQARFPAEAGPVAWYFEALRSVAERTTGMQADGIMKPFGMLDEDFVSLRSVLDHRFRDPLLKGAISAFSMCHGSPPARVSFAAHARVAFGLHQSVGTLAGGGDALADALVGRAQREGVEIHCGCRLEAFDEIVEGHPRRAVLADGSIVSFDRCLLTIDPAQILVLLAPVHPTPAFRERVRAFQPSIGFFVAFGVVGGSAPPPDFGRCIHSDFPETDFDAMMDPAQDGARPMVVIEVPGDAAVEAPPTISALEMSFPQDVAAWSESRVGRRPADYYAYKRRRADAIRERLATMLPYADRVHWAETASMLTFRDYLGSSCGSAYGIMQQVGQYGLFGRLPGRNLYAAGQSALLPGVLGAMMSGLLVARLMVGREHFDARLRQPEARHV